MTEAELIGLAIKMREAQRRYFKSRSQTDLLLAKKLEAEFDAAVKDRGGQHDLF